jgi:hypothetical protein
MTASKKKKAYAVDAEGTIKTNTISLALQIKWIF